VIREDVVEVDIVVRDKRGREHTVRYAPNYVNEVGDPDAPYHYLNVVINLKKEVDHGTEASRPGRA
jgi:hypothetical protein